jgi:hypothetical protein
MTIQSHIQLVQGDLSPGVKLTEFKAVCAQDSFYDHKNKHGEQWQAPFNTWSGINCDNLSNVQHLFKSNYCTTEKNNSATTQKCLLISPSAVMTEGH